MNRLLLSLLSLCLALSATAQKVTISGTVVDSKGEPLPGATVVVMNPDSTQVTGQSTKADGTFTIASIRVGSYILRASYVGYKTVFRNLELTKKNKQMLLGEVVLEDNTRMLRDAVVTARAAQVEMRADTFVYNSDAYRIPEGSNFEALLKKFPGAEITEEGTIKINGKEVKRILVNEKEFFGTDTKMTLKNLPAKMVSKVKAYDRQSDYTRVTGIDDGEEETVLDLTIRKGMGEGWQLNADAGYGTEDRYKANLNLTRFMDNWQVAAFGSANNTNDRGWGGFGGWGGGGGLVSSQMAGVNFGWQNAKKQGEAGYVDLGGNVRYNHSKTDTWSISNSQTFVTSAVSQFVNSENQSLAHQGGVNGDLRIEWQPDSMTNVQFRPRFSYGENDNDGWSRNVTFNSDPYENGMTDPLDQYSDLPATDTTRVNANRRNNFSDSHNYNIDGWLQVNRRLGKAGRNVTVDLGGNISESDGNSTSRSLIHYFKTTPPLQYNNQTNANPSDSWNYRARLSYSEPIFKGANLQFSYQFQRRYSDRDRSLYARLTEQMDTEYAGLDDKTIAEQLYARYLAGDADFLLELDSMNSQRARYNEYNHDASAMLRYQLGEFRLNAGVSFQPQRTHLLYRKNSQDFDVTRNVFNWAPRVDLRWKISNTSQWRLRYNGRMSQPSMTDLLDVEDTSDPLNRSLGNPGLKPSWSNNFWTHYNDYLPTRQMGWSGMAGFTQTRNSIATATHYDTATGVRTTRPENINGNWNAWFWGQFNTALGAKKFWNVSNNVNASYNNSVGFMQDQKSTTHRTNIGDNLRLNFRYDWGETGYGIDLGVNGGLDYTYARNDIQESANLDTWSYSYGGNIQVNLGWGMTFSTDLTEQERRGYADETMNTNELIWNAQLQQTFLKDKSLTVSAEWYDILGQRSSISRAITATQRSDTWTNSIYSYGMIRVIYSLNLLGDKEARRDGFRGPGPGFGGPGGGPGGGRGGRGGGGGFGGPGGRR